MTLILEVEELTDIAPDAWAAMPPKDLALNVSDELARQTAEYLAQGGKIHEVRQGETVITPNAPMWSFPVGKANPADKEKTAAGVERRKNQPALRSGQEADTVLVAKVERLLGEVKNTRELRDRLGVSYCLVYRLVDQYFRDDPRADPFRRGRAEAQAAMYDAIMLPRIRQAVTKGMKGIYTIAAHCETTYTYITAANKKYRLGIEKLPSGHAAGLGAATFMNECGHKVERNARFCPHCGYITAVGKRSNTDEAN